MKTLTELNMSFSNSNDLFADMPIEEGGGLFGRFLKGIKGIFKDTATAARNFLDTMIDSKDLDLSKDEVKDVKDTVTNTLKDKEIATSIADEGKSDLDEMMDKSMKNGKWKDKWKGNDTKNFEEYLEGDKAMHAAIFSLYTTFYSSAKQNGNHKLQDQIIKKIDELNKEYPSAMEEFGYNKSLKNAIDKDKTPENKEEKEDGKGTKTPLSNAVEDDKGGVQSLVKFAGIGNDKLKEIQATLQSMLGESDSSLEDTSLNEDANEIRNTFLKLAKENEDANKALVAIFIGYERLKEIDSKVNPDVIRAILSGYDKAKKAKKE